MLGTPGDVYSASARQATDQATDRGAGMARRTDVEIVEHGVAEATYRAVRRSLGFGKDIDQPVLNLRIGKPETDTLERR